MENAARVRGTSQAEAETEVRRSSKLARTGHSGRASAGKRPEPSLTLTTPAQAIRQPAPSCRHKPGRPNLV